MLLEHVILIATSYLLSRHKQLWEQLSPCVWFVTSKQGYWSRCCEHHFAPQTTGKMGPSDPTAEPPGCCLPESAELQQHHRGGTRTDPPRLPAPRQLPSQDEKEQ